MSIFTLSIAGEAQSLLLIAEPARIKAGERDGGYAATASWNGPEGAELEPSDSVSSVVGRVQSISSTSRLGLLPPLWTPLRFGGGVIAEDETVSGEGLRGLDRARISLGVTGGSGMDPGVADGAPPVVDSCPKLLDPVLAGETKASGVSRLKYVLAVVTLEDAVDS